MKCACTFMSKYTNRSREGFIHIFIYVCRKTTRKICTSGLRRATLKNIPKATLDSPRIYCWERYTKEKAMTTTTSRTRRSSPMQTGRGAAAYFPLARIFSLTVVSPLLFFRCLSIEPSGYGMRSDGHANI